MPGQPDNHPGGRRAPSRGTRPDARRGPGRTPAGRAGAGGQRRPARPVPVASIQQPRPRLTSRAAVLVLIVAVLAVSYASSLRAYLQQRERIEDSQARIAADERSIAALERERDRMREPAFIEQQARERFGFMMPGETPYVVLRDGRPLEVEGTLGDPEAIDPAEPRAWWNGAWESVKIAGNPPVRTDPPPQTRISDPEGAPAEDDE